ncbi:TonB-dependent siderophore receptor [Thauera sinica]|uniref:TonB-dependent siderophore receptor n=1 Tax=Thauera sinica TaxID=2665146 RepID=A0ABW1AWG4_9RHOO|nr:TonB-dependent siderophore receptor [Thauera sp. K11]
MKNPKAKRPASLRSKPAASARTMAKTSLALGISTAMIMPATAMSAENETVLEATKIVDTVIDPNPNAEPNVPYKARTSGDDRHVKPLAETPQTITVITSKQLEDSGTTDLRDILQAQPGITLGTGENGNAFGDRYIIRGQEARSDVFVDGLRDPGMTVRESFATEQVEITKGASSTFAGRGSTGGAVNSITKQATTDLDFAKLSAGFGTDEFRRYTFDGNRVISDTMAVRLNLLDAYREVPDRSPADRDREGAALSFLWKPVDKLDVVADYYHLKGADKPDLGDYINGATGKIVKTRPYLQDEDFLKSTIDTYTLRVGYQFTPDVRLENLTRYGTTRNGYLMTGYRGTTLSTHQGWQDVNYFANALNLHVKQDIAGMKHQFVFGAEYSDHSVTNGLYVNTLTGTTSFPTATPIANGVWRPNTDRLLNRAVGKGPWDSDWNVKTLSLSAMDTVDLTDKWTVFGGLRYDRFDYSNTVASNAVNPLTRSEITYKLDDGLWNGHLGVTYKFLPYANVYANYSTASDFNGGESDVGASCDYGGICVPSVGTASDRVRIFAGSKPEKTQNFELGTKWDLMGGKLLATAALFRTEKSDVMETTSATNYNDIGTINTGKYRIQGLELGLSGKLTDKLMLQAGYAVMKAKILESQNRANVGETLSNFPEQTASLLLSYEATPSFTFGGGLTHSSKKYSGTPEGVAATNLKVPEYTVFDLFAAYKITKQLNARLNVINVTDEDYYTAAYRSGSFTYKGDGRNVRLTLDYNF